MALYGDIEYKMDYKTEEKTEKESEEKIAEKMEVLMDKHNVDMLLEEVCEKIEQEFHKLCDFRKKCPFHAQYDYAAFRNLPLTEFLEWKYINSGYVPVRINLWGVFTYDQFTSYKEKNVRYIDVSIGQKSRDLRDYPTFFTFCAEKIMGELEERGFLAKVNEKIKTNPE